MKLSLSCSYRSFGYNSSDNALWRERAESVSLYFEVETATLINAARSLTTLLHVIADDRPIFV